MYKYKYLKYKKKYTNLKNYLIGSSIQPQIKILEQLLENDELLKKSFQKSELKIDSNLESQPNLKQESDIKSQPNLKPELVSKRELSNNYNNCYINSLIQAIYFCTSFKEFLIRQPNTNEQFKNILKYLDKDFNNKIDLCKKIPNEIFDLDIKKDAIELFLYLIKDIPIENFGLTLINTIICNEGRKIPICPDNINHLFYTPWDVDCIISDKFYNYTNISFDFKGFSECEPLYKQQTLKIESSVDFLVIYIKRFLTNIKVNKPVKFISPIQIGGINWKVVSVVLHRGTLNSGQYIAIDDKAIYNDNEVIFDKNALPQLLLTGELDGFNGYIYFLQKIK